MICAIRLHPALLPNKYQIRYYPSHTKLLPSPVFGTIQPSHPGTLQPIGDQIDTFFDDTMPDTPVKVGKDTVPADSDDEWEDATSSPESTPNKSALTAPLLIRGLTSSSESAVDDSEDLPDREFARARKVQKKRDERLEARSKFAKVQKLLPFQFCPNVRPLTISDLESCVALENAAFTNPEHRCTREKVFHFSSLPLRLVLIYSFLCIFCMAAISPFGLLDIVPLFDDVHPFPSRLLLAHNPITPMLSI